MAYNAKLAQRVRKAFSNLKKIEEKKMMGGLTFMVNGKMCVGILKDDLMVRLDPLVYDEALKRKGSRKMDFTGKSMKGFVFVNSEGVKSRNDFDYWLSLALDFNKKVSSKKK